MAQVTVTRYEFEHDLLPDVCVRCGAPATQRVSRPIPPRPKWRGCVLILPVVLLLYVAVPASIMLFLLLSSRKWRHEQMGLPACDEHAGDWTRRYRIRTRWLWPPVCVASLIVQVVFLTGLILHPALYAHAAAGVIFVGLVIDAIFLGRKEVGIARSGPDEIKLVTVHQTFVDALTHDRARDRVDNPERRPAAGDMRADYEDEPS